ncbi:protein PIGBOS1 [Pimephales promelas]|uniref:protein PIGBOS1 n=1 Tax=Pimephales promelas TaxID=90988 RepID=UPI001955CE5B|nr:protein PIGBOS1 [Pimephales promelas]XP_039514625.1 protein PIGBOS1 [Pimephales promelas]
MFGRRIPFNQIAVATLVGVVGGVYIYRPIFEAPKKPPIAPDQDLKPDSKEQKAEATQQEEQANASATKD